ncbi:M61 family metallopeptidase [Sphingomonas japonica]
MVLGLAGLVLANAAWAQEAGAQQAGAPVEYELSFDNAVHHEARISVTYRDLAAGPVRLQMSRSSPGRYAVHEFAKNVYSVEAKDGRGRTLPLTRTDPYGWSVAGHDGTVTVSYTLFGDRADGTYSQIDTSHAHLNMPATLMWATGYDDRAVRVRFKPLKPDWKIATQLKAEGNNRFYAPNLQYLMDSPTELSSHMVREWPVDDSGTNRMIRLAVHHAGTEAEVDRFAGMAKKIVAEQIKVFGDVPDYDFGTYTFLADYLPWVSGDGMEHRNSTVISNNRGFAEADFGQINTLAHEYFHSWNVERIRPAELEPFDFTKANPTPSLWLAEGFTNYYGPLTTKRAGVMSLDQWLAGTSGALNYVLNTPGRRYGSPQEMSLRAPFVDAAESIDPATGNIFTSYYVYGQVIGMALDLQLRQRYPGVTLDDYMRALWRVHGVTERPYAPSDLRDRLAEVTKDRAFADQFFASTIEGNSLPDYAPLLAQAGLIVRVADPAAGWLGPVAVEEGAGGVMLASQAAPGTPIYAAGLDEGDRIISVGGTPIASQADWATATSAAKPGDRIEIVAMQRGAEKRARVTVAANPRLEVVRDPQATAAMLAFRQAWLGADVAAEAGAED